MGNFQELTVLGTRIASVTCDEAVARVLQRAQSADPRGYVCAVNVHTTSIARRDPSFREVLNGAELCVPDGKPLVWAHRLLGGRKLPDRVYGPTLMLNVCEAAAAARIPIYLYGGKPGVPERLAEVLQNRCAGLQVAGAYSPPFGVRAPDNPALLSEIAAINASGAKICFVAIGAPRQERFMHLHRERIHAVQIGVGAAFDFHTGTVPQAPAWMQGAGLEWLFRFCCEPRRLWHRYLFYNPYFVARLGLQWLGWDGPSNALNAARRAARHNGAHSGHAPDR